MSQYQATKLFGELVRCADIEGSIRNLSDDEVRGLSQQLDSDPQYAASGVPGMIQGLLQLDAARRFMERGES